MDWSVRGCMRRRMRRRQGTVRRTSTRARKVKKEDKKKKSRGEGGEGEEGEAGKHMKPGLEHPGRTCARTGTSGVGAALDWSVRGCIRRMKWRRQGEHAEEQGTVERENTKNKSREAGGAGDERDTHKHMENGLEHPGKQRRRTGSQCKGRPWTGAAGAAKRRGSGGCKKRRGEHEQEQGTVEREDTKKKNREEGGEGEEGEADKHMETGLEHLEKKCTRTGTSGWWRPWTGTPGEEAAQDWIVRGSKRRRNQRRHETARRT